MAPDNNRINCRGCRHGRDFCSSFTHNPFYLLAAACCFRSSDRLYQWLIGNKWCGPYIWNYREYRAISRHAKIMALVLLWGTIGHAVLAILDHLWLRILLVAIAAGVTIYLLRLKTLKP